MKATAFEFRFRVVLMVLILVLGFFAPWIEWLHLGPRTTTWLWLGFQLGSIGITATAAIKIVTIVMIALAAAAAAIRIWGTAYLGTGTVNNPEMKAGPETQSGTILADGPYRYLRNPLYVGSWLMMAAIAALMPPSGSAVAMLLLTVFLFRLILGEEAFLAAGLGAPYLAYRRAVPRLIPSLRSRIAPGGQATHWGRALLGETTPILICLSFAALSWQYNADLLIRAILISFGISLVIRALLPKKGQPPL